jgi:hypothetical protein
MEQDKDPESSPVHEVELDPDEEARRIILARRARFVAVALVSAGVGTAACGGQTGDSRPQPCLSLAATGGSGGGPQVCLGVSAGGAAPCLTVPAGGAYFGTGATTAAGGVPQPCLQPPPGGTYGYGGSPQPCLDIAPPDAGPADAAADAPRDAAPVPCLSVDAAPVPCLSIPQIPNSDKGS